MRARDRERIMKTKVYQTGLREFFSIRKNYIVNIAADPTEIILRDRIKLIYLLLSLPCRKDRELQIETNINKYFHARANFTFFVDKKSIEFRQKR